MKILFIGMGYVGTTMGAVLAKAGHEVTGLDVDSAKIEKLAKGELYFYESGLQEVLMQQIQAMRLNFTTDAKKAIETNDIIFITVGTPSLENGNADLYYVKKAAQMIGKYKNNEKTVVVKSTVPIGTTEKVEQWILQQSNHDKPVNVTMNPEFLREGSALQDALYPNRIVIGSNDKVAADIAEKIYESWDCPILHTTPRGAEMIKYASNSFLAAKVSFINELAKLCDTLGVNVKDVAKGMGLDDRIGPSFLQAGLGYGGSCFPKDVDELLWTANAYQMPLRILTEVKRVNQTQPQYFIKKIKKHFPSLANKKVTLFGLSFKPETDDTRESVSFPIMQQLLNEKANVSVHDPIVRLPNDWQHSGVTQYNDPYNAARDSDIILICTNWSHYKELDWKKVRKEVAHAYVFDGRNMLEAEKMRTLAFHYEGVGYF